MTENMGNKVKDQVCNSFVGHKISIIVPVYNVEKYLHRCIDSIIVQTYTDFEILLIDDGSTDESGNICDEYGKMDGRVRVFHQDNGGVSKARNVGLDNAKGEWVTFCDSDDWLECDYLENFSFNYDLSVQSYFYGKQKITWPNKVVRSNPGEDYLLNKYVFGPYCKLYKLDVIHKNNIRFDEQIAYGEDVLFWLQYMTQIRNMVVSSYAGYHYELYETNCLSTAHKRYNDVYYMFKSHVYYFEKILVNSKYKHMILREEIFNMFHDLILHYNLSYADIKNDTFFHKVFFDYLNIIDRLVIRILPSKINVYKRILLRLNRL